MKSIVIGLLTCIAIAGCGSVVKVREEISARLPISIKKMEAPMQAVEMPRVIVRKGTMLSASEVVYQKNSGLWLRSKTVSLHAPNPITISQVVAQFAAKGINISSDLPLDNATFVGTVSSTDAESALRQILGSAGLDYQTDDVRKIVVIKPLSMRTWYLNLGNRRTSYSSNGNSNSGLPGASMSGAGTGSATMSGQASAQANGGQASIGQQAGAQSALDAQSSSSSTANVGSNGTGTGVSAAEDFWGALDKELTKRLSVMVPLPKAAQMRASFSGTHVGGNMMPIVPSIGGPSMLNTMSPGNGQGAGDTGAELYAIKKVGSHSLNPETGAISVQAPNWILADLDTYFRRTQEMFNTDLSFEGELLLVSRTRSDSEGLDIQKFATWATGRYGAILSNNTLGGVTVSFGPGNIPTVTAGAQQVGGALLGVASPRDGLQIFNAYLSEMGNVSVIQRPRVATSSGVPGEFSNITPRYFNTVSQSAAAGNTGAATQATSNTIVSKDFGTELQIYPRFDIATGLIRAAIKIRNVIPAGEQQIPQIVNVGNSAQTVIARIPLERRLNYSGEALLRDGDLIIVGGQTEESLQADENGLPSSDGPIGGIFGVKKSTRALGTYYFALKVSVKRR